MFFLIAAVIAITFAVIIGFDDLRRERILAYLDPWNPLYAQGKGYQFHSTGDTEVCSRLGTPGGRTL
jgi:cell division protein FtsW (lipid II flippase)